ncbi:hypothetical protein B484DRAFT_436884 [Ochromonadaceae sp. CCMP2298]|nr:hypothetical protein B484DRAFT_436884 [Ochromonadaceae sp. CCMP2298]
MKCCYDEHGTWWCGCKDFTRKGNYEAYWLFVCAVKEQKVHLAPHGQVLKQWAAFYKYLAESHHYFRFYKKMDEKYAKAYWRKLVTEIVDKHSSMCKTPLEEMVLGMHKEVQKMEAQKATRRQLQEDAREETRKDMESRRLGVHGKLIAMDPTALL